MSEVPERGPADIEQICKHAESNLAHWRNEYATKGPPGATGAAINSSIDNEPPVGFEPTRQEPQRVVSDKAREAFAKAAASIRAQLSGSTEPLFMRPEEALAYNAWKTACIEMTTAKAAYDASTVKVRDALQKLAEFATPK